MAKINLRSVATLLDGFNSTYDTLGRVMRDRDIREIARSKVGEQMGPVPDATMVADPEGAEPTKQYTFLGKTYDSRPDDATIDSARQMAMAGVYDKYGESERAMRLRDAVEARDYLRKVRPLELAGLERTNRVGALAEADAEAARGIDDEVGAWLKQRLTGPDGASRTADPSDHMAAQAYRASRLMAAGRVKEAGEALQAHQAGALAKIALEGAQRDEAARQAAAAIASGDLGAAVDFYNRFIPDGATVTGITRGKDGTLTIKRQGDDGSALPDETLKDTNHLLAALDTFRDPMRLADWSAGEFERGLRTRADQRAVAAEGRAKAADDRAKDVHEAGEPARAVASRLAELQRTLLDQNAEPGAREQAATALQGFQTATSGPPKAGGGYKVESGDVTSLLGEPAFDRRTGEPIMDPLTGRQAFNRNLEREREFFAWMRDQGITDTNEALARFPPLQGRATSPGVPPPADRIKGRVYDTPRGPMVWQGKGWAPAPAR